MYIRQSTRLLAALLGSTCVSAAALGQHVYWTDAKLDKIQRLDLGVPGSQTIVSSTLQSPSSIAIDAGAGKMYWVDDSPRRKIQRANLDGLQVEDVVISPPCTHDECTCPLAIAIDTSVSKIYWSSGESDYSGWTIRRANIDGSASETLVTFATPSVVTALALTDNQMYWANACTIQASSLDGFNIVTLITGECYALAGLALDTDAGKLYWTQLLPTMIARANLDGSNAEPLLAWEEVVAAPLVIAADSVLQRLYWTDGFGLIYRAGLDGSDVTSLPIEGIDEPFGLALDHPAQRLYWTEHGAVPRIRRSNVDGVDAANLLHRELYDAAGAAIDLARNRIYWANSGSIQSARLNGTDVAVVVPGGYPRGLAHDPLASKLYWSDNYDGAIRRANLNGTEVQELVQTGSELVAIALDVVDGKLYWTNPNSHTITRANLDGSGPEVLVSQASGFSSPVGLALETTGGKMYWCEGQTIRRADLNGSNAEIIVPLGQEAGTPHGIAVDSLAGKLYWTAVFSGSSSVAKLQRSNLDGSDREDLETMPLLASPQGIVLDLRVPGDCDGNGSTALGDVSTWISCLEGPGVDFAAGCSCADVDYDQSVDLADVAILFNQFGG